MSGFDDDKAAGDEASRIAAGVGQPLPIWVIYDHPLDFPSNFVARLYHDEKPTQNVMISPDLDVIRDQLARHGLVCLARHPDDDPKIVETWL